MKNTKVIHLPLTIALFMVLVLGITSCGKVDAPVTADTEKMSEVKPVRDGFRDYFKARSKENRLAAIQGLPRKLREEQQTELFAFLAGQCPEDIKLIHWHVVVNDTLDRLWAYDSAPEGMGNFLIRLWQNENADPVLRGYALQFIGSWHTTDSKRAGSEQNPEVRAGLVKALEEALARPETDWSGTALVSLRRIDEAEAAMGRDEISMENYRAPILAMIAESAHPSTRITALQVAAGLEMPEALELARQIAPNPEERITLRLSSIAVIGRLGNHSDRKLLQSLSAAEDRNIRSAAAQWLKTLESTRKVASAATTSQPIQ